MRERERERVREREREKGGGEKNIDGVKIIILYYIFSNVGSML